jgi:hypothetical protein
VKREGIWNVRDTKNRCGYPSTIPTDIYLQDNFCLHNPVIGWQKCKLFLRPSIFRFRAGPRGREMEEFVSGTKNRLEFGAERERDGIQTKRSNFEQKRRDEREMD